MFKINLKTSRWGLGPWEYWLFLTLAHSGSRAFNRHVHLSPSKVSYWARVSICFAEIKYAIALDLCYGFERWHVGRNTGYLCKCWLGEWIFIIHVSLAFSFVFKLCNLLLHRNLFLPGVDYKCYHSFLTNVFTDTYSDSPYKSYPIEVWKLKFKLKIFKCKTLKFNLIQCGN